MRNLIRIMKEILSETICRFTYFIKNNLITFANLLNVLLPYVMYIFGQYVAIGRKEISIGGEIFFPLLIIIIIYILRSTANKLGKGLTIPVPEKRFTEIDDYDEVSIENTRVQELILYTADLEDWFEKRGML